MRVAPRIVLSPEERQELLRRRGRGGAAGQRARLILAASDGAKDIEISADLGIDRLTVARWRRRFLVARVAGLETRPAPVRRGGLGADRLRAIVLAHSERHGVSGRARSLRSVAARFGVSHMTVQRLWRGHPLQAGRTGAESWRPEPTPPQVPADIVGVYLHPPAAALALTLRGAGPGEARARDSAPWLAEPGATGTDPGPPSSGTVAEALDRRQLLSFAVRVARVRTPAPPLRILWSGTATSPGLDERVWRMRRPQIEIADLGSIEAWRRRVLETLSGLRWADRGRRVPVSRAEPIGVLERRLERLGPDTPPYEWVAPPETFRRGTGVERLRYALAVTGQGGFKTPAPVSASMARERGSPDAFRISARRILRENLGVRPGERVTIETWTSCLGYANAFALESMRLGATALVAYQDEPTYWAAASEVSASTLARLGENRRAAMERTDVLVRFFGPSDRERYHALPPTTRRRLCDFEDALDDVAARARVRAVQMAIGRVSGPSASMYGVQEDAWREELLAATMVPLRTLRRRAETVARRLREGRELEIRHANGTSLRLRLRGFSPVLADGRVVRATRAVDWSMATLPAGVVVCALDDRSAEGEFVSNFASSTALSGPVGWFEGARWSFRDGRLRRATYRRGQDLFDPSFAGGGTARDRPAAISIGLNERIASAPLLEDQGLGTIGMHIGRNDHLGGRLRGDWWAWSFVRGATLEVDGRPLVRAGKLLEHRTAS